MAELVIAWAVGAGAAAAGLTGWLLLGASVTSILQVAAVATYREHQRRKASRAARDAYNASLTDRTIMVDVQPDSPRTIALGRVRGVEGVRRRWSSGVHEETLTLIVSFASHEIDGFETFYFNDTALTLDVDGWVQTAPYLKGRTETKESGIFTGATYVISGLQLYPGGQHAAQGGSVRAVTSEDLDFAGAADGAPDVVSSSVVLTSTGPFGSSTLVTLTSPRAESRVTWQATAGTSMARIRTYLGTDAQNVGADLAAEYPGKITANDRFAGIALAVVDLKYDPDVYPTGLPNITALFRGARVLDPRSGSTVFSENPALHAYHYARLANGWGVPVDEIRTADVVAAANVCDVSTVFPMRDAAGVLTNVTLPRYRCGITIDLTGDPRAAMDEIFETMAGRWGWAGGVWRLRAGASAAPVFALDNSWVAQPMDENGDPVAGTVVKLSNGVPRESKVNRVTGRCVDQAQRWQVLPFPAVADAALIAAEGSEYTLEVEYQGVSHIAHAQQLARVAVREGQASLRMEIGCNLSAYRCELFDVGTIGLPRYFGVGTVYAEVTGWQWHPTRGVQLSLAETSAAIYAVEELTGRDPAPNGSLPPPWLVERVLGVAVDSGTAALSDGSVLVRTRVTWTPVVSETIRSGGDIEVQYIELGTAVANAEWPSVTERGNASETVITGLRAGRPYVFRVRAVNTGLNVRGDWSLHVTHVTASVSSVGGINTWRQESAPTSPDVGDLWFQPSSGITRRWSGTAWEDYATFGADALTFTGTVGGANLLPNSGFERDTSGDGLADGWAVITFGSPVGRTHSTTLVAGLADGGSAQRLEIVAAGTGGSDSALRSNLYPMTDGVAYVLSGYVISSVAAVRLQVQCVDSGGASLASFLSPQLGIVGSVRRLTLPFTSPTGTASFRVYVRNLAGAGAWVEADNIQVQRGDVLTEWQPNASDAVRKVWRQPGDPGSAAADGDDWFDTDDRYKHYVRSNGAWLLVRDEAATNFDSRNDRNASAVVAPTISAGGAAVDHSIRDDGGADISLEWSWAGTEADIDGFIVYLRSSASGAVYTMGTSPAEEQLIYTAPNKRAQIFLGCAANLFYTFGVQAYRIVDPDINAAGELRSAIVQPTRTEERPYRPSTTVAFSGDVTGTVGGTPAGSVNVWSAITGSGKPDDGATRNVIWRQATAPTVGVVDGDFWFDTDDGNKQYVRSGGAWVLVRDSAATNFDARNDRNAAAIVTPTIVTSGAAVDHTLNTDGSADISFEWAWAGSETDIDGWIVYVRGSSSSAAYTMGATPAQEQVIYATREKRAVYVLGAAADRYYTFGVQAYRVVDPDVNAAGQIKSALVQPTLAAEAPYRPSASVAFGGDITGTVDGAAAAVVAAAAANFNTRNDRDGSAITAPVIVATGNAVDHTLNADGSADVNLEWTWSGTNSSIDGFEVRLRSSTSSSAYVMGTSVSQEQVVRVTADKRIAYFYGMPADRWYTFSVEAYRIVDPDVNAARIIRSTRVQPALAAENPYQPASNVALGAGVVSQTVNFERSYSVTAMTSGAAIYSRAAQSVLSFTQASGSVWVSLSIDTYAEVQSASGVVAFYLDAYIYDEGSAVTPILTRSAQVQAVLDGSVRGASAHWTVPIVLPAGSAAKTYSVGFRVVGYNASGVQTNFGASATHAGSVRAVGLEMRA